MKQHALAGMIAALASLAAPSPAALAQAAETPANAPTNTPADAAAAPPETIEEITVIGAPEKAITAFVQAYAAPPTTLIGQLARWNVAICPATSGLSPEGNTFVTNRVKEVAAEVGVKVETKSPCKTNLQIVFSPSPQKIMDEVRVKQAWLLGSHYKAQQKELATVRHPIQAWYATATADNNGKLHRDDIGDISGQCTFSVPWEMGSGKGGGRNGGPPIQPGPPMEITASSCSAVRGSRVNNGWRSEFAVVTVVVDLTKVVSMDRRPLADYIAMLALAQTKTSEVCQALPSITNLFSPNCDADRKANTLTAYDLAYLGTYDTAATRTRSD